MQTKSQRFAEIVFPNVQSAANGTQAAKYKTLSKKAGSLVRNSGLMQTLAFFRARGQKNGEEHHLTLTNHLEEEMKDLELIQPNEHLYNVVLSSELPKYMVLTREALHLLNWHKRLCETLIQIEPSTDNAAENTEVVQ